MKSKFYFILTITILCVVVRGISQANTSLSNLVSPTAVNQNLLPYGNNTLNLGSTTNSWKTLYIDNNIYLKDSLFLNAKGTHNTFVGQLAGYYISTGANNAAYGFHALYNNQTGSNNSAFGSSALYSNKTVTGLTAVGYGALYSIVSGSENTAIGTASLYHDSSGYHNTAVGNYALFFNTTGYNNTATGDGTLYENTTGIFNTAAGYNALTSNTAGRQNTATGNEALTFNTTGDYNTATGDEALNRNKTGYDNTATGEDALYENVDGYNNTATGDLSLYGNTNGYLNTAMGFNVLSENTTGFQNTAVGSNALLSVTTNSYNTAIGSGAGSNYNVNRSTFVGSGSYANGAYDASTALGYGSEVTANEQVRIGDFNTSSIGGYVGFSNISDGRVKNNIKQNVPGLAFINKLQPITYNLNLDAADKIVQHQRKDSTGKIIPLTQVEQTARAAKEKILYTGFIAQDVEKAAKNLNYDFSGVDAAKNDKDLYSLRYAEFVVPLVKAVQELSKQNDSLQSQINQLRAIISNQSIVSGQQSTSVLSASLAQNIPNPFTGSTSISYTLPQTYSSARLIVTDVKGVVLKQINLNAKGAGNVKLDASTLAAGAYRYSLYVDGKMIDSKQMISTK